MLQRVAVVNDVQVVVGDGFGKLENFSGYDVISLVSANRMPYLDRVYIRWIDVYRAIDLVARLFGDPEQIGLADVDVDSHLTDINA